MALTLRLKSGQTVKVGEMEIEARRSNGRIKLVFRGPRSIGVELGPDPDAAERRAQRLADGDDIPF